MSIEEVISIFGRPISPIETTGSWIEVESRMGIILPDDYKKYIDIYGSGDIGDFLSILNPFSENEYINLIKEGEAILDAYRTLRTQFPEYSPLNVFPEPGGLLPFGMTDNGNALYWKTAGDPNAWTVLVYESRGSRYFEFAGTMTEFIFRVMSRQVICTVFPRDFPGPTPKFTPLIP